MKDSNIMAEQKLLSFIIPVYNGEKTIANCIKTIIDNFTNYKNNIEIIVINDGSTDDTLEQIDLINFKNLKVISKKNGGVSSARNIGIKNAAGKFVWFIDSDDNLLEFDSSLLVDILERNRNIDMILFGFKKRVTKNITKLVCNKRNEVLNHSAFIKEFNSIFSNNEFNVPWNKIIRRSIIEKSQTRFDPKMSIGEDAAFNCSIVPYLDQVCIINQPLYMYNLFLSRNSHGYNPQLRFNLLKLDHILKSLISNQGIDRIFFENKYERMNFSLLTNLAQNCEKYKEFKDRYTYETLPKEKVDFLRLNRKAKIFYLLTKFSGLGYKIVKKR